MQISASMVKELRDRTGAGMMDCKKALQETAGDIEAAIDAMRKSGVAKAAKKAGRIAAEGTIVIKPDQAGNQAVILEVNCETDFVARDENFQAFSGQLATVLLDRGNGTMDVLGNMPLNNTDPQSVEEARQQLVTKLGENISIRRSARINKSTGGALGIYLHGIRIGVIVDLSTDNPVLAKDIAMHIAAANPLCVDEQDVPPEVLEKEREIQLAQARQSGKPDEIIEKMVSGRIKKFLRENTLSGQAFVKDPDISVAALLKANNTVVNGFIRYEVGEGIEKKADNFAAEVMQQAGLTKE
jgi:elongation factor Ts